MAEPDVLVRVTEAIDARRSFILEAGAGSGKTYALVYGLRHVLESQRTDLARRGKRVACITYTRVAKAEIAERLGHDPLVYVGTIHEFLWSVIGGYQAELKRAILDLNAGSKKPVEDLEQILPDVRVTYSDRGRNFARGRVSHDEVLKLATALFNEYPKMARLAADKYPYLFVDEYQDTQKSIVSIILDRFRGAGSSEAVVGFFGDSMQKIYNTGVGAVHDANLAVITKHDNFRCSEAVIRVLNQIRPTLRQVPAGANVEGEAYLFAGGAIRPEDRLAAVRDRFSRCGWTEENTKILMLTHRKIAGALEYQGLLDAFEVRGSFARDRLLDGDDEFADTFRKIEILTRAYDVKDYAAVLQTMPHDSVHIRKHSDKLSLKSGIGELRNLRETATIGEVLDFVFAKQYVSRSSALRRFYERLESPEPDARVERDRQFMESLKDLPYSEVVAFVKFRDSYTPFSTQHGVKGAEYENVIVAIDDGAWSMYNMDGLLAANDNPGRIERSRNLFYVCCSRAKSGLAVVFLSPLSDAAMKTARTWFGADNVLAVDNFHE